MGCISSAHASGLRAPELAAGSWEMVFGRLLTSFHEEVNAHILGVTDLELGIITNDLHRARTVILDELKSKLHFWRCLPWRCCALAHPDVLVARDHAKQILDDWEAMDQSPVKHHPMTIHMLTGSLKDAIVAFRDGGCRFADDELSALCARLYFVPVNERTIEGIFSQTRLAAENRRVSPPFVSFALRFPMWEQQCKRKREPDQPSLLHLTIDAFQHVRKRRKLPAALGLEGGPGVAKELVNVQLGINQTNVGCTHALFRETVRHMYTSELTEQYRSIQEAKQHNKRKKDATRRQRATRFIFLLGP